MNAFLEKDNLFTGERVFKHKDSLLYQISEARYLFALDYVKNKNILDIACGSGYGSNLLSGKAKYVLGLDIDERTIKYCKNKYKKNNLEFRQICRGYEHSFNIKKRFDVIISFETIEHVEDCFNFLKFLKKNIKPNGVLILSSPNNFMNTYPPKNHFHLREFDILELCKELKKVFTNYKINLYGQCKTNVLRSSGRNKTNWKRRIIGKIINIIYEFDSKYLKLFNHIEYSKLYKIVGALQRNYNVSSEIYKIDPEVNYINPCISIFVVTKNGK